MLTVKFMKYGPASDGNPTYTSGIMVRECESVHATFEEGLRTT